MDASRPTDVREQDMFDEFHLGDVRGRAVIDRRGMTIGTIEDAAIDPKTWRVSGFILAVRRELAEEFGLPSRGFMDSPRINLGADRVATFGENVLLNVDARQIREMLRRPASEVDYDERARGRWAGHGDPLTRVDDPALDMPSAGFSSIAEERRWP